MTSDAQPPERLQKILARAGVGSRRAVEDLIREGRVTVNGTPAVLGQRADLETDAVKVDGKRIFPRTQERRYLLLNKPAGTISTVRDPEERQTVLDLVPQRLRAGLVPVGRLDYDTEGLMLLTDDGELAQRVAHPRYGCRKTYEVKVKGRPDDAALDRLRRGIVLDGRRTAPAEIRPRAGTGGARRSVSNSWWIVVLTEGRTRQIREMFFRIGHPVSRLRRVAIGPLADPHLPLGRWRELTEREVELLRAATEPAKKKRKRPAAKRPAAKPAAKRPAAKQAAKRPAAKRPATKPTKRPATKRPATGRGKKDGATAKGRGPRSRRDD